MSSSSSSSSDDDDDNNKDGWSIMMMIGAIMMTQIQIHLKQTQAENKESNNVSSDVINSTATKNKKNNEENQNISTV